jgi:RNA-directed DNA polymerase
MLISKRNMKTGVYSNIFEMMVNRENLFKAWISIKNKAGNFTHAGNKKTLDGFTDQLFSLVSERLLKGTYIHTAVRRAGVPKAKGGFRSFTIANPRDKVIQKAFLQVLKPIWEGA